MRVDLYYRLSLYLTLTIATFTLGYAEAQLFPLIIIFMIPVGGLLLTAYAVEGRWSLSHRASDGIALAIAIALIVWTWDTYAHARVDWVGTTPLPGVLLPFSGPFLILLLLAKLFRPKTTDDLLFLQLLGLMEVALACVLALDPLFAIYLTAYLAGCLWSLMLWHQYRDAREAPPAPLPPNGKKSPAPELARLEVHSTGSFHGLGAAVGRTFLILPIGIMIFLLTPRLADSEYNFTKFAKGIESVQTGFAPTLDLNHTGRMQVSSKVVFQVYAEDAAGNPKTNLPADQRWRGLSLDHYDNGRWTGRKITGPPDPRSKFYIRRGDKTRLPDLGTEEFYVTVNLNPNETKGLFLAEPVVFNALKDSPPVIGRTQTRWAPRFHYRDDTLIATPNSPPNYQYTQVLRPRGNGSLTSALEVGSDYTLFAWPRPLIKDLTQEVLQRLVKEKKLAQADIEVSPGIEGAKLVIPPRARTKVARALESYLSRSPDYTYTLDMKRIDSRLDPVEDFLLNVKQGHCEHFATALVAMLRCAGIPARMVNGFRGAEKVDDTSKPGWYEVKESHAHAWVEALVGREDSQNPNELYWLTLDPSPVEADTETANRFSLTQWWERTASLSRVYWRSVFIDGNVDLVYGPASPLVEALYTPFEARNGAAPMLARLIGGALLTLAGLLGAFLLIRRRAKGPVPPADVTQSDQVPVEIAFYHRFLEILRRLFGLRPRPSQTPLEFGEMIRAAWHGASSTARFADLPLKIVELFYRVRYGGRSLAQGDETKIKARLDDIEETMRPVTVSNITT